MGFTACSSLKRSPATVDGLTAMTRAQEDYAFLEAQLNIFSGELAGAEKTLKLALSKNPSEGPGLEYEKMLLRLEVGNGQTQKAYERAQVLTENFPENVSVLREAAQFFYEVRMKEQAFALYSKLTELSPEHSNFWIYKGLLALELSNIRSAWGSFDFLINKSSDAKHLGHMYMGKLMQMTNFPKKAERSFKSCIKVDPKSKECVLELAEHRHRLGEHVSAVQTLENFLKKIKAKESGVVLRKLSDWSIQAKNYKKAAQYTEMLERLDPSSIDLKRKAALLFVQQGRNPEAKERMKIVVNHSKAKELDVLNYLNILELLNQNEEAHAFLEQAVLSNKLNEQAFFKKFEFDKKKTNSKEAQKKLKSSCKIQKINEAACLYVYSYVLLESGSLLKARRNLERLVNKKSETGLLRAKYFLSQIYAQEGKTEKSLETLDQILKEDEVYGPALNFKAYTLAKTSEDLLEAERLSLRALAVQPRNGHYLDTYGWILHKKGSHKEALAVLQQAFELKPDEPEILEHIADVYVALSDKLNAIRFYKLASHLFKGENHSRVNEKISQTENVKRSIGSVPERP